MSEITGGKFANGAITSAFAQALNGEETAKAVEAQKGATFSASLPTRRKRAWFSDDVGSADTS